MSVKKSKAEMELEKAFNENGYFSVKEKRKVMIQILGNWKATSSLSNMEIAKLLNHLGTVGNPTLHAPITAWVCSVGTEEGMTNKHIRVLLGEIPPHIHVLPFFIEAGSSAGNKKRIAGFIDKNHYEEYAHALTKKWPSTLSDEEDDALFEIQGRSVRLLNADAVKPKKPDYSNTIKHFKTGYVPEG